MTKQDISKPPAGNSASAAPAAVGQSSTQSAAPAVEPKRETGGRDGLVIVSIAVVSVAIAAMFFVQFRMPPTMSLLAGAVAWAVFMLFHKQLQKSAQIAQLRAELAHTRALASKPKNAAMRLPPVAPPERRTPVAGAALARSAVGRPGPQAAPSFAVPGAAMSGAGNGELRAGPAEQNQDRPDIVLGQMPDRGDERTEDSGARVGPSLATVPPAAEEPIERRGPQPEIMRDQWSFRPRADAYDPAMFGAASLGTGGPAKPVTTVEGDLELVQRKIKELADEVNAADALRAAKPRPERPAGKDRLASDALEESIGALKAAAETMRDRAKSRDFVPTLGIPPAGIRPTATPDGPQLGDIVIPATAQRIAGTTVAPPDVRGTDDRTATLEMRLPEFPAIDLPTDPGPSLPLPPRVSSIASAVENDASEAYLSPIVTLSENAVSHYELAVELVSASGERLDVTEEDFVLAGGELAQRFDIARLTRAAALAQRMEAREKGGVLLTEFMGSSLTSRAFLEIFASFYEARPAIAGQLVLTFRQRAVDELPQAAWQALRDMHEFGFRFALDRVEHMGSDFALLARSGFKFVRLDSAALLEGFMARDRFVEAQEVHQRLTLAGLTAIASGIGEAAVQQRLLASGVTLGQGPLFGEPRRLSLNGPTTGAHSAAA